MGNWHSKTPRPATPFVSQRTPTPVQKTSNGTPTVLVEPTTTAQPTGETTLQPPPYIHIPYSVTTRTPLTHFLNNSNTDAPVTQEQEAAAPSTPSLSSQFQPPQNRVRSTPIIRYSNTEPTISPEQNTVSSDCISIPIPGTEARLVLPRDSDQTMQNFYQSNTSLFQPPNVFQPRPGPLTLNPLIPHLDLQEPNTHAHVVMPKHLEVVIPKPLLPGRYTIPVNRQLNPSGEGCSYRCFWCQKPHSPTNEDASSMSSRDNDFPPEESDDEMGDESDNDNIIKTTSWQPLKKNTFRPIQPDVNDSPPPPHDSSDEEQEEDQHKSEDDDEPVHRILPKVFKPTVIHDNSLETELKRRHSNSDEDYNDDDQDRSDDDIGEPVAKKSR